MELDALHPEDLINIIDEALRAHLDIYDMLSQQDIQSQERQTLKKLELGFMDLCHEHNIYI